MISIPILLSGLLLGALHSLEPDHLAAMSTLIGRSKRSPIAEFLDGAIWGVGHSLALGLFGAVIVYSGAHGPAWSERLLESLAGLLLIALGVMRLRGVRRGLHEHHHHHGDVEHEHFHLHLAGKDHDAPEAHRRHSHAPIWIGILHGLAGTGAVLVIAPALIVDDPYAYSLYVLAFGLGSVLAMGVFCGVLGRAAGKLRERYTSGATWFATVSGVLSVSVGVVWLWRVLLA